MNIDDIVSIANVPTVENSIVLIAYLMILGCLIIVVSGYKKRALQRMERIHHVEPNLKIYEIAFLAGGASRVLQTAIFRLYQQGLLSVKTNLFHKTLVPVQPEKNQLCALDPFEQIVTTASWQRGKLVSYHQETFRKDSLPELGRIETYLAQNGYRPTERERAAIVRQTCAPFLILGGIGSTRVMYGILHGNPFWYLLILVVATFIIAILASNSTPKVTESGRRRLNALKKDANGKGHAKFQEVPQLAAVAVAIGGASALYKFAEYNEIIPLIHSSNNTHGDSSSSSGCGSSGCGGGGCGGGCGGGGD